MVAQREGVGLLTIGTIFVVVFTLMYGGVELSQGELLPADTTNQTEEDTRGAMWTEINERRADRGFEPMPSDRFVRGIAQDTTDTLVADTSSNGTERTERPLTNTRLFCTQVPVSVQRSNDTAATAVALVDELDDSAERSALYRPSAQFRSGIGVAIDDGRVYAVFRSCEQVDT